ncbi:type II secretion system protein [Trinickia mobilis]|uniref:type II secretion system protein n=1 Tax=Trinickia mobilis TaxID=2816356 RepID=UPI001F5C8D91|nr:prepilin-type N-terminal cleavage/methylation domain-containing protein [Trinickia mobilis]
MQIETQSPVRTINAGSAPRQRRIKPRKQRGFTLLEVIVVVAILGIIAWIVAPKLFGSTDNAKALAYSTTASGLANNWRVVNQNCGTSSLIASSAITTNPGPAGALQLLVDGVGLNATYQACYQSANTQTLHESIQGSAADGYTLNNSVITLSDANINGKQLVAVQYAPATDAIVLANYQKYSSVAGASQAISLPAAADTTDPKIQFSTDNGGTRTMTIFE